MPIVIIFVCNAMLEIYYLSLSLSLSLRPVQEMEGGACTGGGKDSCPSTGVERRGLYRRWCGACTGDGKESLLSVLLKNDKLDRRRTYRGISE
jgi:hypothetical protein